MQLTDAQNRIRTETVLWGHYDTISELEEELESLETINNEGFLTREEYINHKNIIVTRIQEYKQKIESVQEHISSC